jgi:L-ascorbate metabolism protein UlaG (beta-lactamase superfamily)
MVILASIAAFVILVAVVLFVTTDGLSNFGANPSGARLELMKKSPYFDGKKFKNPVGTDMSFNFRRMSDMTYRWVKGKNVRWPHKEIPVVKLEKSSFEPAPPGGLRITWMGHSAVLIEIDGKRVLTDPMWGKRSSPSSIFGPKRFFPPPISLGELLPLDAVVISHAHFDHLDKKSVLTLAETGVRFFMPLGVGSHFEKWGVEPAQFVELDWWDQAEVNGLQLVATPARHFSGRNPFTMNRTLWASFAIIGPEHRVYFSGDSGPFPGFAEIGEKYGPFDVTLMETAAYDRTWPEVHQNPPQAVAAHLAVKGDLLMPIHYGTFRLALHDWNEPPAWLVKVTGEKSVRVAIPRPGQMVDPKNPPPLEYWWE